MFAVEIDVLPYRRALVMSALTHDKRDAPLSYRIEFCCCGNPNEVVVSHSREFICRVEQIRKGDLFQ